MEEALKTKWLAALRNGAYHQIRGALKSVEGVCCLGVLCDVVDPDGWTGVQTHAISNFTDWPNPYGMPNDIVDVLVRLNDVDGLSFELIADWIEENI